MGFEKRVDGERNAELLFELTGAYIEGDDLSAPRDPEKERKVRM